MNPFDLTGKVAVVTGASRGIGLASATAFAEAGANVVLASDEPEVCAARAGELVAAGYRAIGVGCDVTRRDQLELLVWTAEERFGGIDILMCNAGASPHFGPIAGATDEEIELTMTVNLRHTLWLTNLVASKMAARGGGAILMMSSIAALRGADKIGVYALAKAAIAQLARNIALEWGPSGIRANSLAPGLIRTNFGSGILDNPEVLAKRLAATPLRRLGEVEDIAGAALFLVSEAGSFITGQNLVIDGGLVIHNGN